jgi:hypothetical protein
MRIFREVTFVHLLNLLTIGKNRKNIDIFMKIVNLRHGVLNLRVSGRTRNRMTQVRTYHNVKKISTIQEGKFLILSRNYQK